MDESIIQVCIEYAEANQVPKAACEAHIKQLQEYLDANLLVTIGALLENNEEAFQELKKELKLPALFKVAIRRAFSRIEGEKPKSTNVFTREGLNVEIDEDKSDLGQNVEYTPDDFSNIDEAPTTSQLIKKGRRMTTLPSIPASELVIPAPTTKLSEDAKFYRKAEFRKFNGNVANGPQWLSEFEVWRKRCAFSSDSMIVDAMGSKMTGDALIWWTGRFGNGLVNLSYQTVHNAFTLKFCDEKQLEKEEDRFLELKQQEGESPESFCLRLWRQVNIAYVAQPHEVKESAVAKQWIKNLRYQWGKEARANESHMKFEELVQFVDDEYQRWRKEQHTASSWKRPTHTVEKKALSVIGEGGRPYPKDKAPIKQGLMEACKRWRVCYYYQEGTCKKGSSCQFSHRALSTEEEERMGRSEGGGIQHPGPILRCTNCNRTGHGNKDCRQDSSRKEEGLNLAGRL
jgi:hypothetical protein